MAAPEMPGLVRLRRQHGRDRVPCAGGWSARPMLHLCRSAGAPLSRVLPHPSAVRHHGILRCTAREGRCNHTLAVRLRSEYLLRCHPRFDFARDARSFGHERCASGTAHPEAWGLWANSTSPTRYSLCARGLQIYIRLHAACEYVPMSGSTAPLPTTLLDCHPTERYRRSGPSCKEFRILP